MLSDFFSNIILTPKIFVGPQSPFCSRAEADVLGIFNPQILWKNHKIHADAEAIKFMVNLDKPIQPQFIDSPAAILSCKEPAYFITRDKDFADLPENVKQAIKRLDSGNIGYRDCIIFNLRGSL